MKPSKSSDYDRNRVAENLPRALIGRSVLFRFSVPLDDPGDRLPGPLKTVECIYFF
jgi:hypothetical protein